MEDLMLKSIRETLSYKRWWIYFVSGIAMIFIGFLWLVIPNYNLKFEKIVYFCVTGFIINDICDIISSASNKTLIMGWWWQVIRGIVGILFSLLIVFLFMNDFSLGIIYLIDFWFLSHSIYFIGELFDLKHKIPDGLILILILSLIETALSLFYIIFSKYYNNSSPSFFILFLIHGIINFILGFKHLCWNKEVIRVIS